VTGEVILEAGTVVDRDNYRATVKALGGEDACARAAPGS
jgi:hypothetical protein